MCAFFCTEEVSGGQVCALDELLVTDMSDQEALDDFLNSSANDARGSTSSLTSGEPDLSLILMFLLQCLSVCYASQAASLAYRET